MTERTIQNHLWLHLHQKGHTHICPNYTPRHWQEMDVFSTTKSGFMIEHEIKVSRADFKQDAKKSSRVERWGNRRSEEKKHDRLLIADENGPSRFFYVVPADLIKVEEVPEWTGLLYATSRDGEPSVSFSVVKDAPRLHSVKVAPAVLDHVRGVFYWRFWNERRRQK